MGNDIYRYVRSIDSRFISFQLNLGFLVSVDQYMNVQLDKAVEYIDEQNKGPLGEILIRCNNILYISGIEETGDDDDAMAQ